MPSAKKANKGRPQSTSALAQPAAPSSAATLHAFSPDASHFALVTLAVDKHRLRIYNTATSRAVAEYTVDSARVSSLIWTTLPSEPTESDSPAKKRRKGRTSTANEDASSKELTVVALGLSDGVVQFFPPSHSKVARTLSNSASTSSILALAADPSNKSHIWTSSTDSTVRLWDIKTNAVLRSWKNEDRIASTSIAVRPTLEDSTDLLVGHHHIRLLADVSAQTPLQTKPAVAASFTGHASSITSLLWSKSAESTRFFSTAEDDRFVYVWDTTNASTNEKAAASISLDADVRAIAISGSESSQILIALSSSGKLSFIPIPSDLPHGKSSTLHSLLPRATLISTQNPQSDPPVIGFAPSADSTSICVARLVKGTSPVFDNVIVLDDDGHLLQNLSLGKISQDAVEEGSKSIANKRYQESSSVAVGTGFDIDQQDADENSEAQRELDGALQVDLAELSLGQRLTAVTENNANNASDSENEDGTRDPTRATKSSKKKSGSDNPAAIPANSLTRTLIQALHSSDSRLLELCLAHSDPALISNTVRRLPPQLSIPLITACVERLGRGPRAANMKGRGGGASSQRGSALLVWLKTVLAVHTGHLMTIPDLVARLSGLHATLTARLSLHDSLLSLSGRLDMVLSQVEMRAAVAPPTVAPVEGQSGRGSKAKRDALVRRYVEGETDSEDEEEAQMDVEVEADSDQEGSIEDIELGGDSENEESDEAEFSDSEGEEGGFGEGFIDDEAEEFSDDEEDDESE